MPKHIVVSQRDGASFKPLAVAVEQIVTIGTDTAGRTILALADGQAVTIRETIDAINKKLRGRAA